MARTRAFSGETSQNCWAIDISSPAADPVDDKKELQSSIWVLQIAMPAIDYALNISVQTSRSKI